MAKPQQTFTRDEIIALLSIPCCHTSGMHDPLHFVERKYVCEDQKSAALENLCRALNINPVTKSVDCWWCEKYPEKRKGEGLPLFDADCFKCKATGVNTDPVEIDDKTCRRCKGLGTINPMTKP